MADVYPSQNNLPLGYGQDLSCVDDLTSDMAEATGRVLVGQAIARRLQTPRGGLIDDPDYGYDLASEIDDDLDAVTISRIASRVRTECLKDERVIDADVLTSFVAGVLTLVINLKDRQGPYRLVFAATNLKVELVRIAA